MENKMLKEAYDLLEKQYQKCLNIVQSDAFFTAYADEKKRHSMQVAGAGNYLIRHVAWLQNKPADFIELVKTAVLLHDISRFDEIAAYYKSKTKLDHGVIGAELLQQTPPFDDIRIWLPIKHHGHKIEELYADPQYQNITDKNLQNEIKQICFVIRDADKIANLNMVVHEKNIWFLFLGKSEADFNPATDGTVSPEVRHEAFLPVTIDRNYLKTFCDRCLSLLSWYTDINYQSAIDYCRKLNVTAQMLQIFADHCSDSPFRHDYLAHFAKFMTEKHFLA